MDIWTDRRMHAYLAVTAHVFKNGEPYLKSYLLVFKSFTGSHTGQHIAANLESVVEENGIQTKIRSIVTDSAADNAANTRKAISVYLTDAQGTEDADADQDDPSLWNDDFEPDVGDLSVSACERIACFAHSLQLVVRDGLSNLTVARSLLAKYSKLTNLVHQSALFRGSFETAMGSGNVIPRANETRWNSTFRQLRAIRALDKTKLNALLHDCGYDNLVLTSKDIALLGEVLRILLPFCEATDLTQGDKTVTISCVTAIVLSLDKQLQQPSNVCSSFASTLRSSLRDRFAGISIQLEISIPGACHDASSTSRFNSCLFLIASALDPTYAFHWLQDHPGPEEQKDSLRRKITGMLYCELSKTVTASSSTQTEAEASEESAPPAKRHCSSLFGHYKRHSGTSSQCSAENQLAEYIQQINSVQFDCDAQPLSKLCLHNSIVYYSLSSAACSAHRPHLLLLSVYFQPVDLYCDHIVHE